MSKAYDLGLEGEALAADFLRKKGYTILDTRWVYNKAELDIVALHDQQLVIAEVKTRSDDLFGPPEKAVNLRKQKKMFAAADYYVDSHDLDLEVRFDIVAIVKNAHRLEINHIEDAFTPL